MSSYRSVFTIRQAPDTVIPQVLSHLITWVEESFHDLLGSQGLDAFSPGMRFAVGDDIELLWIDRTLQSDDRLVGFVIIDSRGQGERIEQVMLAGGPRDPGMTIVSVEVGGQAVSTAPSACCPAPAVVNQLLAEFPCEDYGIMLTHWPLILRTVDIDSLLKELSKIDHHVQVIVAATDDIDHVERMQELIGRLMAPAVGMSAAVILDPQATRLFNERVTPSHAVAPGSLRLYVPGAQFGDAEDGAAHEEINLASAMTGSGAVVGADLCTRTAGFATAQTLARRERRYLTVLGAMLDDAVNGARVLQSVGMVRESLTRSSPHGDAPEVVDVESSPVPTGAAPAGATSKAGAGSTAAQETPEPQDDSTSQPRGGSSEHIRVREELVQARKQVHELQAQLLDARSRIARLEKECDGLRAPITRRTKSIGTPGRTGGSRSATGPEPESVRQGLRRSRRECQELREELDSMRIRALAAEKRNRILAERFSRGAPGEPAPGPGAPPTGSARSSTGSRDHQRETDPTRMAAPTPPPARIRAAAMIRTPLVPGSTSGSSECRANAGRTSFQPAVLAPSPGEYREWHSRVTRSGARLRNAVRGADPGARAELIAIVQHILAAEAPVHRQRLGDLVRNAYGLASLRTSLREALWDALVSTRHMVIDDLGFVWSIADQHLEDPVVVRGARRYALDHVERLDRIHPHELAITLAAVAKDRPWLAEDEVFKAALSRLSRRHRQLTPDNLVALRRAYRLPHPGRARLLLSVAQ